MDLLNFQGQPCISFSNAEITSSHFLNTPNTFSLSNSLYSAAADSLTAIQQLGSSLDHVFGPQATEHLRIWVKNQRVDNPSRLLEKLGLNLIVDTVTGVSTGAYSESLNAIYLSSSFIKNASSLAVTQVLVEEIGHAIDAKINNADSRGDEGERFASLVFGLNTDEYHQINEDDIIGQQDPSNHSILELNSPVTIFEHANYTGRSKQFGIGDFSYIGNDFNDILTSVRIQPGSNLVAEFFQHANFQGRSTVVSYSQASIGADWNDPNWKVSHMNDQVSSLKVRYQRPDEIIFYQHANYQGLGHSGPLGSNRTVMFNDDYSSIDLPRDVEITVFEHSNFGGARATYTSDAALLGNLNDKISSYSAYKPDTSDVRISRVQGPNIIENKESWFVIHGWNNSESDFQGLASAIEDFDGVRGSGDQVFTVDWKPARSGLGLTNASLWIDTVAEIIKGRIASWGIDPWKINIVGHSLGAYVAYEVSERLSKINRLVAMNPASLTVGGYNWNQVNFSRYSNWSWAFHHNDTTDLGFKAQTAHESFILQTPVTSPWAGHGSTKVFWTDLLRNKTSNLGRLFGLNAIKPRTAPWSIDSGWEAKIELNRSFIATGKYWQI